MIKLLIGGSPCTFWSIAQKNGRETEASGLGWELFKNYLIAKKKFNPDFFLYENNKSAAQAIKDQISHELGVPLMYINSALVSAQNRNRFYAFNWEVDQPEDRGILLRDILETSVDEISYKLDTVNVLSEKEMAYMLRKTRDGRNHFDFGHYHDATQPKSACITATLAKGVPDNVLCEPIYVGEIPGHNGKYRNGKQASQQYRVYSVEGKSVACDQDSRKYIAEPIRVGTIENNLKNKRHDSKQYRVYSPDGKSTTLCGQGGGVGAKTGLYATPSEHGMYQVRNGLITVKGEQYPIKLADGDYIIRKLTPVECERLQTLPDGYTKAVSNTQRYKGLGNGWTAEVIIHILNGVLKNVPRDEEIVVLSMYDGIGTGRYCLDKMGFTNVTYFAYEIDKYAKQVAKSNYPDIIHKGDAFDLRHPDWTIGY